MSQALFQKRDFKLAGKDFVNQEVNQKDEILDSLTESIGESTAQPSKLSAPTEPTLAERNQLKTTGKPSRVLLFTLGVGVTLFALLFFNFLGLNDDVYAWWLITSLEIKSDKTPKVSLDTSKSKYGILKNAASAALSSNRLTSYKKLLISAISAAENEWGKYSIPRGDALMELCAYLGSQRDWKLAKSYAKELEWNQQNLRGPRDSMLADAYAMQAWIANDQKQYNEAQEYAFKALLINERCSDPESLKLKGYKKFLELLKQHKAASFGCQNGGVLERHAEAYPANEYKPGGSSEVALHRSAFSTERTKDYGRAEKYYTQALDRSAVNGDGLQCKATILNDYSCMLHSCGRHEEAKATEARVDAIRLQIYSRDEYGTDALIESAK